MVLKGKAYKFGDNISTDLIISGRYKFAISDMKELARHVMEDADSEFVKKLTPGAAFIVAGVNFGLGSSREQAPAAIKAAGISAVLAKNFARIFYRNSINIALPLIECDTDKISDGDELTIDLEESRLLNITRNSQIVMRPLPPEARQLLSEGGLLQHFRRHGGLKLGA
jgi:3-isopropylmalate/(R)-2-methylmalate dehydratase small subunit